MLDGMYRTWIDVVETLSCKWKAFYIVCTLWGWAWTGAWTEAYGYQQTCQTYPEMSARHVAGQPYVGVLLVYKMSPLMLMQKMQTCRNALFSP